MTCAASSLLRWVYFAISFYAGTRVHHRNRVLNPLQLSSQRGQLLASSSSSELINAHVPSGHPSVSKLQICMLDLAVLEYRLNELTNGTNN